MTKGFEDAVAAMLKEDGAKESIKDGCSIVGVFPDGVIEISMVDNTVKFNVIAGEPAHYDIKLGLLEEAADNG